MRRLFIRLAKTQRKTKSEIALELLRRHMLVRELDGIRDKLRPYAETAGYMTDEDFIRNI